MIDKRPRIIDVERKPQKCSVCGERVVDIIYGTGDMTEIELTYGRPLSRLDKAKASFALCSLLYRLPHGVSQRGNDGWCQYSVPSTDMGVRMWL